MVNFSYKGKNAYIDDRLAKELDETVIPDLVEKDSDVVFVVDGNERIGKSKFADILCGYVASKMLEKYKIDVGYGVENFHLSPLKFRNAIINAKRNEIAVYDEAHKGMGSRRSLSEVNNILNDLMMEMGQKNLFVVLVLPTFFMLDKYPAIFRTRGLFHIYKGKNPRTDKRERGYWVYFNEQYKLQLYIKGKQYFNYNCIDWPGFRGRFYDQYIIDEAKYREKKKESFKQHGKRETKGEIWKNQRNRLIFVLHKELKIGRPKLLGVLKKYKVKLSDSSIKEILVREQVDQNPDNTEEMVEENEDLSVNDDNEG